MAASPTICDVEPLNELARQIKSQPVKLQYHAARNQFERFRGVLELINRFELDFLRRENYFFERFEFLVCSITHCGRTCACAAACLHPHNSNSNVVVSLTVHDDK